MEYKYYKHNGEGYKLLKSSIRANIIFILFTLMGALGIWYTIDTGKIGGIGWLLACLIVIALVYYRQRFISVIILPQTRMIVVKHGAKVFRQFPFDKFMNFQKTRIRTNGVTTQWHVSMYVNDNGKNRNIMLESSHSEKAADQIIAETTALLNSSK